MESGREAITPLKEIDLCKIMKCDKQERINNLQSKIDKAIEYIDLKSNVNGYDKNKLLDILKEDK